MKTLFKTGLTALTLGTLLMADLVLLGVALVPDAHAILGVRRRTAVVAGATVHAADSAQMAQSQQQAANKKHPLGPTAVMPDIGHFCKFLIVNRQRLLLQSAVRLPAKQSSH